MTKEEARHLLPVIKAYSEGKAIQHKVYDMKDGTSEWEDLKKNDEWNWRGEYRIKPEPKYRPFKDAEECWNEKLIKMKIKAIFKRLLFVLLSPLIMILTGMQILGILIAALMVWIVKGNIISFERVLLIEKAFKLIEKDETD